MQFRPLVIGFMFLLASSALVSQDFNPLAPPNSYRSAHNPFYWKNRPPYAGYWQQDVHYRIKANIDEKTDIIDGSMQLTYTNNSPDTLTFVYFHLYQNAFQPGSYYDNLQENNKRKRVYGEHESQGLGTVISRLQSGGIDLRSEPDNTILKVWLAQPLLPNGEVTFDIDFKTYWDGSGNVRRRMKTFNAFGFKHYDGVHWYPRLSVYDHKFGWTTDQHLGREFYGNFGCYEVELTFANHFVVGATGNLLNEQEVLPPELRQKLDITNFLTKRWNSPPSIITEYSDDPSTRKTWKFHAENVHDFAFTADPTYRIGETSVDLTPYYPDTDIGFDKTLVQALVQEPHVSGWWNATSFTAKVVQTYSEFIGPYGYPKIIVADARDGMEYPMLTLDGGYDPHYRDLLAHEVGHNWFFGMVGSNETYRAFLDEGFTQFIDAHALEVIDGPEMVSSIPTGSKWQKKFREPILARDGEVYYGYIGRAAMGDDAFLNTHSDGFGGALRHGGGYSHVYYKTATMLYNLQYVLGDDLFWKAMQFYFDRWKFCHPYPEDFRQAIIDYTKVDLNWFFDQWLETDKKIDYAVKRVKRGKQDGSWEITFKRKERMEMPIDFAVVTDVDTFYFHIPNRWFVKQTTATVLPKWHGWDLLHPEHTAVVAVEGKVKDVIIDPSGRLADIYMVDNGLKTPTVFRFDSKVSQFPDWRHYRKYWGPSLWYNEADGIKIGIRLRGDYLKVHDRFDLTLWGHTGLLTRDLYQVQPEPDSLPAGGWLPFSYSFTFRTMLPRVSRKLYLDLSAWLGDGVAMHTMGLSFTHRRTDMKFFLKALSRPYENGPRYSLYPNEWQYGKVSHTANIVVASNYRLAGGTGRWTLALRSSATFSDFLWNEVALEKKWTRSLGPLELRTREYGRYITGMPAPESALYLAGASPEDLLDDKWTRSAGPIPSEWGGFGATTNHFHQGGGLNLRGYAGYYGVEVDTSGNQHLIYRGNSGISISGELDFDGLIKIRPKFLRNFHLDTYLFGDAGAITYTNSSGMRTLAEPRADAGVGLALTIRKFWHLDEWQPLTIRVDFPMYLSHVPFAEVENFQFRWVVGVGRSF